MLMNWGTELTFMVNVIQAIFVDSKCLYSTHIEWTASTKVHYTYVYPLLNEKEKYRPIELNRLTKFVHHNWDVSLFIYSCCGIIADLLAN